ncbi:sulfatase-like hydrolase/transferase [Rickettsiales bacterium]|nr:sulfatase-like hydrolase/transferase [Rickettsiales bacterium]
MLAILEKKNILVFKVILVTTYLVLSNQNLLNTLFVDIGHNSKAKMLFYMLASIIFSFFFFYCSFQKKIIYRTVLCIPLITSSFFSQLYYEITNQTINIDVIEIALISKASYVNFINQYLDEILINLVYFLIGIVSIIIPSKNIQLLKKKKKFFIFFFLYFSFIFSFSISRGGFGQHGLPSQLKALIPFTLVNFTQNFQLNTEFKYEKNFLKKKSKILIIDESISFDYFKKSLSFEDFRLVANENFFKNTRKFYSLHNCSAQSVWSLFNGLILSNNKYYIRKNLWKIAKENDYETIYFSAQEKKGSYQYLQKPDELTYIDTKFFYGSVNNKFRDTKILDDLKKHIKIKKNQFIVILKNGSHFPYSSQFDYKKYKIDIEDENIEKMYLYSIKENTINFLDKLAEITKNKDFEIFYLSDHGQNILDGGLTHCNSNSPIKSEWEIPLLLYNVHDTSEEKIKNNTSLYDGISNSLGENTIRNNTSSNLNYLFYGSLNKRFGKTIKKITIKVNHNE